MNSIQKPTILISGSKTDSKSVAAIVASVRAMGAEPMVITAHEERLAGKDAEQMKASLRELLAQADGIIVMGNDADIDPALYSAAKNAHTKSETETTAGQARSAAEFFLIREAIEQKKPFMGVCGGMQRLNVMLGGDLHQHIPELFKTEGNTQEDNRHSQPADAIAPYIPVEYIELMPNTLFAGISKITKGLFAPACTDMPENIIMDNSMHHQAVKTIAPGLRVAAVSKEPDRPDIQIIEALEPDPKGKYAGQFMLGVQWHPEFGASDVSAALIQHFVETSREFAKAHPRETIPLYALAQTSVSIEQDKLEGLYKKYHAAPGSWADYVMSSKQEARAQRAAG